MPPGHQPRLSALSALRSVRETGEGRAARRLQSRQRHCRLRWRGSRAPARARTRARCARGLRMRRPPSPSSRWQSARACRRVGGVVEGKVAGGRNSAAVAPPALIEYRALRAAAQSGSGASIATSLAAAVVAHLVAALEAVSTALDAV